MIYCAADAFFNSLRNATIFRKTVEEYNTWLIEKWNSRVTKDDTVFIFGTFYDEVLGIGKILDALNGKKIVILSSETNKETWRAWGIPIWDCTLHSRTDLLYSFSFCNERDGEISPGIRKKYTCYFSDNYHGNPLTGHRLNISFGMWNFEPLSLDEIPKIIQNLEGKTINKK